MLEKMVPVFKEDEKKLIQRNLLIRLIKEKSDFFTHVDFTECTDDDLARIYKMILDNSKKSPRRLDFNPN